FRVNAVGRLFEEVKHSLARQGDHARPDQYSVQITRRLPVNFGRSGVPLRINAPSLPGAAHEVLQMWKDGPIRFAKEAIVDEDRLGTRGRGFVVEGGGLHWVFASRGQPLFRASGLTPPTARAHHPQPPSEIAAMPMGLTRNLAKPVPRRRIRQSREDAAIRKRL